MCAFVGNVEVTFRGALKTVLKSLTLLSDKGVTNSTNTGMSQRWCRQICLPLGNTRAKRLRMCKDSIFKLAVANANFATRMPVYELKSNFISIQNFKAGNVKPPGMHWRKDF